MTERDPSFQFAPQDKQVEVWDIGVRVFHWSLVLLMIGSFVTIKLGKLEYHTWCGYSILTLLLFRILWGFVGGTYARFTTFVKGPAAVIAYFKGLSRGARETTLGHNPMGALSVLAMLAAMLFQASSGLLTNSDDFSFEAALYKWVGKDLSDKITTLHRLNEKVIFLLVGLHLAAIAFYYFVKKHNLVKPMITGTTTAPADAPATRRGSTGLALVLLVLCAGFVYWLVKFAAR